MSAPDSPEPGWVAAAASPASGSPQPARKPWEAPELEELKIRQAAGLSGIGGDGGPLDVSSSV